jgi:hypothetical protein
MGTCIPTQIQAPILRSSELLVHVQLVSCSSNIHSCVCVHARARRATLMVIDPPNQMGPWWFAAARRAVIESEGSIPHALEARLRQLRGVGIPMSACGEFFFPFAGASACN